MTRRGSSTDGVVYGLTDMVDTIWRSYHKHTNRRWRPAPPEDATIAEDRAEEELALTELALGSGI